MSHLHAAFFLLWPLDVFDAEDGELLIAFLYACEYPQGNHRLLLLIENRNTDNLKDIERALQLRARITEVTLRSDHDDVSPESPPNLNPKSTTLPDCLWSVCCFLPHLKNCFVTSEQQ